MEKTLPFNVRNSGRLFQSHGFEHKFIFTRMLAKQLAYNHFSSNPQLRPSKLSPSLRSKVRLKTKDKTDYKYVPPPPRRRSSRNKGHGSKSITAFYCYTVTISTCRNLPLELAVTQLLKKLATFMVPECSLWCSEETSTGTDPEPIEMSAHPHTLLKFRLNIILTQ